MMKLRQLTLVVTASLLLGSSSVVLAGENSADKPASSKRAVRVPKGWPTLKKGMSADEVTRLIGKPESVKPLKTNEGAAEVWTYRREISRWTDERPMVQGEQEAFITPGAGGMGTIYVPEYRMEHITDTQVSSLLMFEGQLVTATQKVERERRLD